MCLGDVSRAGAQARGIAAAGLCVRVSLRRGIPQPGAVQCTPTTTRMVLPFTHPFLYMSPQKESKISAFSAGPTRIASGRPGA